MSRTIRSTEATTRACSIRKTSARRARTLSSGVCGPTDRHGTPSGDHAVGAPARRAARRGAGPPLHRPDRSHVDVATLVEPDLLGPLDGLLPAVAVDQVEAPQRLLGLGEGTVHDLALAGLDAEAAPVGVGAQPLAVDHLAGRAQLLGEAAVALDHGLHLGGSRRSLVLVGTDQQQVSHRQPPYREWSGPRIGLHLYDAGDSPESTAGQAERLDRATVAFPFRASQTTTGTGGMARTASHTGGPGKSQPPPFRSARARHSTPYL